MRCFRYSVNGASFAFIKGDFEMNNLYGNTEEISEELYNACSEVYKSYAGTFQVLPTMLIAATKVLPGFDERTMIGQQAGNTKYLWVWKDETGNVWAEVTFLSNGVMPKQEKIN